MFSSNDIGLVPFECRNNIFLRRTKLHASTVRRNRVSPGARKRKIKSMRAVVQRVASASVEVEGRTVSEIGPGLLVLVGLHGTDVESDADYICRKVLNMRLFPNEKTGKSWDQNVVQRNYEVLLVSQFTLYGVLKGNKPDFQVAMPPDAAKPFYASLVEKFQKAYKMDAVKGIRIVQSKHCKIPIIPSYSNVAQLITNGSSCMY
ncbi:uncharacterized protein [Henckelia pumila]|uniref:uncharacterized protein isoform X3 n=1 Tax=Henckelia pumila TaxID=405737 RepID=UPI003C6EA43D